MKQEAFVGTATPSKQLKVLYKKTSSKNVSLKTFARDMGGGVVDAWLANKAGANNAKKKPKKVIEKKADDKKVLKKR